MNKTTNLHGVAYIRAINTPEHFKKLAQEAKDIFEKNPNANKFMIEILTKKDPNQEILPGPELTVPMTDYIQKVLLLVGKKKFLDCRLDFNINEKQTLIHDIVTEITIKDGIVTKIEIPNLKYAYGD